MSLTFKLQEKMLTFVFFTQLHLQNTFTDYCKKSDKNSSFVTGDNNRVWGSNDF